MKKSRKVAVGVSVLVVLAATGVALGLYFSIGRAEDQDPFLCNFCKCVRAFKDDPGELGCDTCNCGYLFHTQMGMSTDEANRKVTEDGDDHQGACPRLEFQCRWNDTGLSWLEGGRRTSPCAVPGCTTLSAI